MTEFEKPFDLTSEWVAAELAQLEEIEHRLPGTSAALNRRREELRQDPIGYFDREAVNNVVDDPRSMLNKPTQN
ncbi:hypothetical protein H0X10_02415 [Candidatus Saccharibacteria bacterium]|nr:hypothetical protein [Candidatus Saccharibacteria bacterium]